MREVLFNSGCLNSKPDILKCSGVTWILNYWTVSNGWLIRHKFSLLRTTPSLIKKPIIQNPCHMSTSKHQVLSSNSLYSNFKLILCTALKKQGKIPQCVLCVLQGTLEGIQLLHGKIEVGRLSVESPHLITSTKGRYYLGIM